MMHSNSERFCRVPQEGAAFSLGAAPTFKLFAWEKVSTSPRRHCLLCLFAVLSLTLGPSAHAASTYKILHAFSGPDGGALQNSVVLDGKGRIYGTTNWGGAYGYGTVFKLARKPNGHWIQKTLHSFDNGSPDGQQPLSNLVLDDSGNIYGTTSLGGVNHYGTAFEMSFGPAGWTFSVIYNFCSQPDCADGAVPWAGLVFDKGGALYGTAGNVFALTPGPSGWTESVLYNFCSQPNCSDGRVPYQGVILDAKGNLYGATYVGGDPNCGVVYKLRRQPDGSWKQRVLHSFHFDGRDGCTPGSAMLLAMDSAGNLYGTTKDGGRFPCDVQGCGVIFKLTRQPNGQWQETILFSFSIGNGGVPNGGVVIDSAGNLYGSTVVGGDPNCSCGVVYKLAPQPDGTWKYSILHRFTGDDGYEPVSNLILDDKSNVYGTTLYGGPGGSGVVFEITP